MDTVQIFGVAAPVLFSQILLGVINGSFYALLSLGLSIIFGLLNIANFAHGVQYMMGAFLSYVLLTYFGISYWWALLIVPIFVGMSGVVIEQLFLKRIADADHLYGLLLTFGIALMVAALFRIIFGASGIPYQVPAALSGGTRLGFMFLPHYRVWVVGASLVLCIATWAIIERTRIGSYLRAATENPTMSEALGVNVPYLVTLAYAFGAALAGIAGVLAAPIYQVNPDMGNDLLIIVFAVVVIGGVGSIAGSIVTGYILGIVEGVTKAFYPEAAAISIFLVMVVILAIKPSGIFGRPL